MELRKSRREFLAGIGAVAAAASFTEGSMFARERLDARTDLSYPAGADPMSSPFRVAVINDEVGQDFDRSCAVIAREFGLEWIELRGMWSKNLLKLDAKEVVEARRILEKYKLRVTDIASPLFKVDWPGAPKSQFSPKGDQFNADFTYEQQDEVLERSIELAKAFQTDRVRCFDFWRLEDQSPYRTAINQKLLAAAEVAGKKGITLLLENEPACNTATAAEAVRVLSEVKSASLMLNWDPGNAASRGEKAFPDGYALLPKERIGHCHCKDVTKKPEGNKYDWAPMGKGLIDWTGQFAALKRDGYRFAVSLETHWRGAGTAEESTRQSWAGMKDELQKAGAL
jgi:L-ribulose-5-phosphate 3-epimerase